MLISLGRWDCGTTVEPVYEWFWLDGLFVRSDKLAEMLAAELGELYKGAER